MTPPNAWQYDKSFNEMLEALKMVREKLHDWNQSGPTLTQINVAIKRASLVQEKARIAALSLHEGSKE